MVSPSNSITKSIIYETDFTGDVDDVGALAVLHALVDREEAKLLMVSYNEVHPDGPRGIQAINTWYGRPDIPIGVFEGDLEDPDDSRYLPALSEISTPPPNISESTELYGNVLSQQKDQSVTIVSVGFLNNLVKVLDNHEDLIARKVSQLVLMGGLRYDSYNFVHHNLVSATEKVLTDWPTPIVVLDFGFEAKTGTVLSQTPVDNPVRIAYTHYFGGQLRDRPSWDHVAVLYGVRGTNTHFEEVSNRTGVLRSGFRWELQPGYRLYAQPKQSKEEIKRVIEELMIAEPQRSG